ncbi:MAG: hypothetical protein WDO74_15995 [Pseudomonadota bacterium]
MTEPARLLSTPESELERALLDAGRSYTASASMRAKTLLALGLTAVATSSAPSAAAASSSLTKATFSKVAVAVLVIGAAAVPVWRYLGQANSTRVAPPPPMSAALVSQAAPTAVPAATVPLLTVPPATLPPASVESAELQPSSSVASALTTRAEPRPTSTPPLAAELAALDAARTSLSHSDPSAALVALDRYARNFPRGRLSMEAEVLRIGALAKSGQTDAARKRAEAFLRRHPDSVLASRVRSYAGL